MTHAINTTASAMPAAMMPVAWALASPDGGGLVGTAVVIDGITDGASVGVGSAG